MVRISQYKLFTVFFIQVLALTSLCAFLSFRWVDHAATEISAREPVRLAQQVHSLFLKEWSLAGRDAEHLIQTLLKQKVFRWQGPIPNKQPVVYKDLSLKTEPLRSISVFRRNLAEPEPRWSQLLSVELKSSTASIERTEEWDIDDPEKNSFHLSTSPDTEPTLWITLPTRLKIEGNEGEEVRLGLELSLTPSEIVIPTDSTPFSFLILDPNGKLVQFFNPDAKELYSVGEDLSHLPIVQKALADDKIPNQRGFLFGSDYPNQPKKAIGFYRSVQHPFLAVVKLENPAPALFEKTQIWKWVSAFLLLVLGISLFISILFSRLLNVPSAENSSY